MALDSCVQADAPNMYYFMGSDLEESNKIKLVEIRFGQEPALTILKEFLTKIPSKTWWLCSISQNRLTLSRLAIIVNMWLPWQIWNYTHLSLRKAPNLTPMFTLNSSKKVLSQILVSTLANPMQIISAGTSKRFLIRFSDSIIRMYDPVKLTNAKDFWRPFAGTWLEFK